MTLWRTRRADFGVMHRDATAGPIASAYAAERAAWEESWLSEHAAHSYPA